MEAEFPEFADYPSLICGPVMGLITQDSARILIELDKEQTTTMELRHHASLSKPALKETLFLPAKTPRVFQFNNLLPGTKYYIDIVDVQWENAYSARFRTLPVDLGSIRVAVQSCNFLERKVSKDMWKELYTRAKKDHVNLVLHLGDNVYMDGQVSDKFDNQEIVHDQGIFDPENMNQKIPYVRARTELLGMEDKGPEEWEAKRDTILEIYRSRYRETWTKKYTAMVLASFSNLMILDDHEIRDDFGLLEEDGDPQSMEFWLGTLALQVYHEYQRQLWDPDILSENKKSSLYNEFYSIKIGRLGIAMTDARTPNSIYKPRRHEQDKSYYGNEQIESLKSVLDSDAHDNVRMWLIGCGLPLMFFKETVSKKIEKIFKTQDDLEAFTNRHESDLVPILDAIKAWKNAKGPAGDVIVLAGDVHIGGFTDIHLHKTDEEKELVCHQVTTSPIRNKHWSLLQYAIGGLSLNCTDKYENFSYTHYDWVNGCNFLILRMDFQSPLQVHYNLDLVLEKGSPIHKSSTSTVWNSTSGRLGGILGRVFGCTK